MERERRGGASLAVLMLHAAAASRHGLTAGLSPAASPSKPRIRHPLNTGRARHKARRKALPSADRLMPNKRRRYLWSKIRLSRSVRAPIPNSSPPCPARPAIEQLSRKVPVAFGQKLGEIQLVGASGAGSFEVGTGPVAGLGDSAAYWRRASPRMPWCS